ncbi:MAG: hypothetical protein PF517_03345 [Salinivirgaceae bacterium]|jgi:hypothetical protein|nr:hypothetical protein [Salinivirgaceae bacterium]
MKKLNLILFASILAFASCNKDDRDDNPETNNSAYKGSYTLNIDGKEFNTLIQDVMYITDYNRVEIYGAGADQQIMTLHIGNIPANNNESAEASTDGGVLLTYEDVLYSSMKGSGTITRLSSDKIKFDDIVVWDLLDTESKTFSGTATIGETKSL